MWMFRWSAGAARRVRRRCRRRSPRGGILAVAFDRETAVGEKGELAHRADAAAPLARGHHVLAQLVTVDPERQVGFHVLDRDCCACWRTGYRPRPCRPCRGGRRSCLQGFPYEPTDPRSRAAESDDSQVADPGADLFGVACDKASSPCPRAVARTEACDHWSGEDGVSQAAFWSDDGDRPGQAAFCGNAPYVTCRAVSNARHPDGAIGGAFERHVDRPVRDLGRGAGEVDGHFVAGDGDGHGDRQVAAARVGVIEKAVDML